MSKKNPGFLTKSSELIFILKAVTKNFFLQLIKIKSEEMGMMKGIDQIQDQTWCPAIEFNETDTDLILKAEIPGVNIKNINISAESESISISGIHDHHKPSTEKELIPSQLHYGQLDCQVSLPEAIQVNYVRAELIDGVLTITMPKLKITSAVKI